MRTLRELIPKIETDWLLPVWLLLAIAVAAVAETWTIGTAVERVYDLQTGWAIGGVVASAQAIGSMMWSRSAQHNAARVTRTKNAAWPLWVKVASQRLKFELPAPTRRIEDKAKSQPRLNVTGPAAISILAGIASAWIGIALYSQTGLTGLDIALAVAAPAGSVAAAALNGVFAYGEAALAEWTERPTATSRQPRPPKRQTSTSVGSVGKPKPASVGRSSQALALHLATLKQRLERERQNGRTDDTFARAEVEEWLKISESHARNVIAYGRERGMIEGLPGHRYQFQVKEGANEPVT